MSVNRRGWMCLSAGCIVLIMLLLPLQTVRAHHDAKHTAQLNELDSASEALYRYMQDGNGEKAQVEMDRIVRLVETISFKGLSSVEGIHALSETVMDTREALVRSQSSPEEWRNTSSRLRLAVDSLIHKQQPLWHQYYKLFTDDLSQLAKARSDADAKSLQNAVHTLKSHYETIRPAAAIQLDNSIIAKADSWLSYLESVSMKKDLDASELKSVLDSGEGVIHDLFGKKRSEPVLLPLAGSSNPWKWSLLIGGWIALALTYTGMRHYNAYQEVRPVSGSKDRGGWRF
ncbi:sporulation protein YpjB [Paenibacillus tuaregi]|uniref:sporulation protein YpjB n=1 Tax=Paenibacillus tuaregi TaxID=1816681 RepID=UPI00083957EC|nr:sporulation protein YpjB [Paenibacillus tuaregi]